MGTSAGNTAARVWLGVLVAALHGAVLMLLLSMPPNRPRAAVDIRALTVVNVDSSEQTVPADPPMDMPEPTMRLPESTSSSPAIAASPNQSAAVTEPALIGDWRASLEAAATAAVGKAITARGYQPLGPVERGGPGSSAAPSIFEAPRRKAGDIDHDATQGRTLIWHNENCYTELRFPTIKDPNALVGAPNPPKCVRQIGERKARGDLFKPLEEPASPR